MLAVATVAVLAPLLLGLLPWLRVPQVVLLLVGGMVIGPQLLALARPEDVQPLSDIGLGFVSCWRATRSTNVCTARRPVGAPSRRG